MKKPFPIFVDLETTPPLVIGNDHGLDAKIRLLLKFAPVVDLITDLPKGSASILNVDTHREQVRDLSDVACADAVSHIQGRPLVIIDTADAALNKELSDVAKALGVPVNVPDQIALCSFFLASIVDRAPVTVAISTSGVAPVLGQNIRAKIEDMLGPKVGDLAHYLFSLRDKLRHLPAAVRRQIQHQIIDGPVFRYLQTGKTDVADAAVVELLSSATQHDTGGTITIIDAGSGAPGLLSLDAVSGIRSADVIFFDKKVSAEVLDFARREAELCACFDIQSQNIAKKLRQAGPGNQQVIYLVGEGAVHHHGVASVRRALAQRSVNAAYIPSASNHLSGRTADLPQFRSVVPTRQEARVITGVFQ